LVRRRKAVHLSKNGKNQEYLAIILKKKKKGEEEKEERAESSVSGIT